MKISFLIPTKDRLDLLKHTIASIVSQPDCGIETEIVITDNASNNDYRAYVASLADGRIVYYRHETPVSVTENWQKSLSLATGDYILMLGDDDAIAPAFMPRLRPYISESGPDLVYVAGFHYCYPGVIPNAPDGYLSSVLNSEFLPGQGDAFDLDPVYARGLAESVLNFHLRFGMNSQHFVLKSSFARSFGRIGGLFQSPYPDTFAAAAVWTHAKSITVLPEELVIIGISPRSFGAYYFSGRHDEGYRFLDNEQVDPDIRESLNSVILPGDRNNTNWLVAVASAKAALPNVLTSNVGTARYRVLQIVGVLRDKYLLNREPYLAELYSRLSEEEALLTSSLEAALAVQTVESLPKTLDAIDARLRQYEPAKVTTLDIGKHSSIWDAYVWLTLNPRVARAEMAKQQAMRAAAARPPGPAAAIRGAIKGVIRNIALAIPPLRKIYERKARARR